MSDLYRLTAIVTLHITSVNVDDLFRALWWGNATNQRLEKKTTMMHKTLNGTTSEYRRSSSCYYSVTCPDNSNGKIDLKKNEAFFRLTEPLFGRHTLCKLYTDDDTFAIVGVT